MTRINAFIPYAKLCDKHLLAEHREIVRVPNQIKSGKLSYNNIPDSFRLGTGHVKFFCDKLKFLHKRYTQLYLECKNRGFKVQNMESSFCMVPQHLYNDFNPSEQEINRIQHLLIERINERMPEKPKYTNTSINHMNMVIDDTNNIIPVHNLYNLFMFKSVV